MAHISGMCLCSNAQRSRGATKASRRTRRPRSATDSTQLDTTVCAWRGSLPRGRGSARFRRTVPSTSCAVISAIDEARACRVASISGRSAARHATDAVSAPRSGRVSSPVTRQSPRPLPGRVPVGAAGTCRSQPACCVCPFARGETMQANRGPLERRRTGPVPRRRAGTGPVPLLRWRVEAAACGCAARRLGRCALHGLRRHEDDRRAIAATPPPS